MKIIADIDIRIAIQIDIGNSNSQAITDGRTIDAGFFGYISKSIIAIIPDKYCP